MHIVQTVHNPVNRLNRENKCRTTNADFILSVVCVSTDIQPLITFKHERKNLVSNQSRNKLFSNYKGKAIKH